MFWIYFPAAAVLVIAIAGISLRLLSRDVSGEWMPVAGVPNSLMRRKRNGQWEYRPMTDEESADFASSEAW